MTKQAKPVPCLIHDVFWRGVHVNEIGVASVGCLGLNRIKQIDVAMKENLPGGTISDRCGTMHECKNVNVARRPRLNGLNILQEAPREPLKSAGQPYPA